MDVSLQRLIVVPRAINGAGDRRRAISVEMAFRLKNQEKERSMDRFQQLTAYFEVASEFHQFRDSPTSNVVSLMITLPELLEKITQPPLRRKLQHLIAHNADLLPSVSA